MFSFRSLVLFLFFPGTMLMQSLLPADEVDTSAVVRVRYSDKAPARAIAMDTAVVHFEQKSDIRDAVTIDLIGAVHIADAEYYEKLNRLFTEYDVVLFELVAEEGTRLDPKAATLSNESRGLIGGVQNGFADLLKLEHQLHHIDYTPRNMIHADMAPELFLKRMFADGEMAKIFARAMTQSLKQSAESDKTAGRMFGALLATRDKSLGLKRIFAVEMCKQLDDQLWVFEGDEGSTLIRERNGFALAKLRETIDRGEKKIAIFYGAAHLYDFNEQLEKSFNMKPVKVTWIKAWDLGENGEIGVRNASE
ncbi:MAG: hypothetical protein FWD31_00995 [Planctomycetaceae bacterium]|nr:hypothetical protein [Planctomycetaceae bacterium]